MKINMKSKIIFPFLFLCVITATFAINACSLKEPNIADKSQMKKTPEKYALEPVNIQLLDGMTPKDLDDMIKSKENEAEYKKFMIIVDEIAHSDSQITAHQKAKVFIESQEGKMLQFLFVQQLSHFVLRKYLSSTETSEEKSNAIEYHLNNLVKYKSFGDKILFAQSLKQLQGKWTSEKIKHIAKECLEFGSHRPSTPNFDFEQISKLSPEDRKKVFMNDLLNKRKIPMGEAIKHAEILERVHQDRINGSKNLNIPNELPLAFVAQEQAIKTLASFAGEKFTSYSDRMKNETRK